MDAYSVLNQVLSRTYWMGNIELTMDVVSGMPTMVTVVMAATAVSCHTDDSDCWTLGSMVASDMFVETVDDLVVVQPWPDSTLPMASMRYVCVDVATDHRMMWNVYRNMLHRHRSNCMRMAFVKRLPKQPIAHGQKLATFDVHNLILLMWPMMEMNDRIVYSPVDICRRHVVLVVTEHNQYRMDHGIQVHRLQLLAFSCVVHSSSMDSWLPWAWHDAVTSKH